MLQRWRRRYFKLKGRRLYYAKESTVSGISSVLVVWIMKFDFWLLCLIQSVTSLTCWWKMEYHHNFSNSEVGIILCVCVFGTKVKSKDKMMNAVYWRFLLTIIHIRTTSLLVNRDIYLFIKPISKALRKVVSYASLWCNIFKALS